MTQIQTYLSDSGSLEYGTLLQSFCPAWRMSRTPEKKESCAVTALPPRAPLRVSPRKPPKIFPFYGLLFPRMNLGIQRYSLASLTQEQNIQQNSRTLLFALYSQLSSELLAWDYPYLHMEPADICPGTPWESCPSSIPTDSLADRPSQLRFGTMMSYAIQSSPVRWLLKTHFSLGTLCPEQSLDVSTARGWAPLFDWKLFSSMGILTLQADLYYIVWNTLWCVFEETLF